MKKIRVALVEDHDLTRMTLKQVFQSSRDIEWLGEAENATDGLTLLQTLLPDVAIIDISLPDFDGIELVKKFKETANDQTKILMLTLYDKQAEVMAAFRAGVDSYCVKTTTTKLLLEAVRVTAEGHSWIDPLIAHFILSKVRQVKLTEKHLSPNPQLVSQCHPLTERELAILRMIVHGYSNVEIAERLFITIGTVKTHVRNILNKLSAEDRTQAAVLAVRSGLVS